MGLQLKFGGKFHLKLNIGGRPIAYKYREGKVKSTPMRGVKQFLKSDAYKLLEGESLIAYLLHNGSVS